MDNTTFEEVIREHGRLIYTNVGDSMYPLIKPRDLLCIEKLTAPLKKNDIPLYKRENGQYVLHRIIKIKNGNYYICGDNRCSIERGIKDDQILGILTEIIRNGKTISVYSDEYKLYNATLPARRYIILIKNRTWWYIARIKRLLKVGG